VNTPRRLPTRTFAAHPDLDQLKRQVKALLSAFRAGGMNATPQDVAVSVSALHVV
jgi:hypothetical protein